MNPDWGGLCCRQNKTGKEPLLGKLCVEGSCCHFGDNRRCQGQAVCSQGSLSSQRVCGEWEWTHALQLMGMYWREKALTGEVAACSGVRDTCCTWHFLPVTHPSIPPSLPAAHAVGAAPGRGFGVPAHLAGPHHAQFDQGAGAEKMAWGEKLGHTMCSSWLLPQPLWQSRHICRVHLLSRDLLF